MEILPSLIMWLFGFACGYAVRYIQKKEHKDLGSSNGSYHGTKGRDRE